MIKEKTTKMNNMGNLARKLIVGGLGSLVGILAFPKRANAVENDYYGHITFHGENALQTDRLHVYWQGDYNQPISNPGPMYIFGDGWYLIQLVLPQNQPSGLIDIGLERDSIVYMPLQELGPDIAEFDTTENGKLMNIDLSYGPLHFINQLPQSTGNYDKIFTGNPGMILNYDNAHLNGEILAYFADDPTRMPIGAQQITNGMLVEDLVLYGGIPDSTRHVNFTLWNLATNIENTSLESILSSTHPEANEITFYGTQEEYNVDLRETAKGDTDGDGDIDLDDLYNFNECFSGPGQGVGPNCEATDFDNNGKTDMLDFKELQKKFTGSQ